MFTKKYIEESIKILNKIEIDKLEKIISVIANVRKKQGRIFFLGVGGSAANASHAVNDFRKLACIESYAPTDNVSELTARTNKVTKFCLRIPSENPKLITPHTEGFQALIWHLIISHPKIQINKTKW